MADTKTFPKGSLWDQTDPDNPQPLIYPGVRRLRRGIRLHPMPLVHDGRLHLGVAEAGEGAERLST